MNNSGKGGRLLPPERAAKKEIFLKHYASCYNVRKACKAAGINRNTFAIWIRNGTLTDEDMRYATGTYQDEIRTRLEYSDGYDPWAAPMSRRQLRLLAYRHLPELRHTKFGEKRVNIVWWTTEEVAELNRLINRTNQRVQDRKYLELHQQEPEEEYEYEDEYEEA